MPPAKRSGPGTAAAPQGQWVVDLGGNGTGPFVLCVHPVNEDGTSQSAASGGSPSGGLTNTELRAEALSVLGPLTNAQLRAAPVPIAGEITFGGVMAVTGPLTNTELRSSPVPVTGTFWQAIQPVSGTVSIGNTVAVSGGLTNAELRGSPVPVTGTFWQVTQPVSFGDIQHKPGALAVTATGAAGAAVTLTLPAPPPGQSIYLMALEIWLYATAARTGGATPVVVTTTGLPGNPAFTFETAQAIGTVIRHGSAFAVPLKASAPAQAVTVVAPIATTGIWRMNAYYYVGA